MDEGLFWLRLWQSICVGVVLLAFVIGGWIVADNYNGLLKVKP